MEPVFAKVAICSHVHTYTLFDKNIVVIKFTDDGTIDKMVRYLPNGFAQRAMAERTERLYRSLLAALTKQRIQELERLSCVIKTIIECDRITVSTASSRNPRLYSLSSFATIVPIYDDATDRDVTVYRFCRFPGIRDDSHIFLREYVDILSGILQQSNWKTNAFIQNDTKLSHTIRRIHERELAKVHGLLDELVPKETPRKRPREEDIEEDLVVKKPRFTLLD